MKLILSRTAMADLERLLFLANRNPAAAQRAVVELVNAIDRLALFPDRGRPAENGNSRDLSVPFGRSGYVIRFRHNASAKTITVTRVWHSPEAHPRA